VILSLPILHEIWREKNRIHVSFLLFSACGGLVTNYPANLTVPKGKNQSVECIWIIQVPLNGTKKSVNIVLANITVKGYKNASK
jgi:hypothetical protein